MKYVLEQQNINESTLYEYYTKAKEEKNISYIYGIVDNPNTPVDLLDYITDDMISSYFSTYNPEYVFLPIVKVYILL